MDDFGTSFDKKEKGSSLLDSGPAFSFEQTAPVEAFPKSGGVIVRDFGGDSTNEQKSSSSTHRSTSPIHHSMGPGHQITSDGRIKAGDLTFNLPGFNSESTSELESVGEALSPTTTRDEKSGQDPL